MHFLPDPEIFEKTRFSATEVKSRLHETAYLNPNLTIVFTDKRDGKNEIEEFHEPDGLSGFIRDMNKNKETVTEIIYFKGEADGITVSAPSNTSTSFTRTVLGFCKQHLQC